jgi:hypothetical protein
MNSAEVASFFSFDNNLMTPTKRIRFFKLYSFFLYINKTMIFNLPEDLVGNLCAEEQLVFLLANGGDVAGPEKIKLRRVRNLGNNSR